LPRTRTQVRQRVARELGFDVYATGTADSGGSTTTLKDSPLQLREDDFFIGAYVNLTSGSPTFTDLEVTDSTQSTGLLTFRPTLGAAPDTLTYEVLPYSATAIHNAVQDVLNDLFEERKLERQFWLRGLVAGSPTYNAGFDYWDAGVSAVPHGYEAVSGATVAKNTAITAISDQSMALTSTLVSPTQVFRRYFYDMVGESVTMYCWVYTTAASSGKITLRYTDGGSNTDTSSSFHTGNAGWELLSVTVKVPSTAEDIRPIFDGGATITYFGDWFILGGQSVYEYPFPVDFAPHGPEKIYLARYQGYNQTPNPLKHHGDVVPWTAQWWVHQEEAVTTAARRNGYLVFDDQPTPGRRFYIQCRGPLTMPSADANVMEININEEAVIAKRAAIKLLTGSKHRYHQSLQQQIDQRIQRLELEVARMMTADARVSVLPWQGFTRRYA